MVRSETLKCPIIWTVYWVSRLGQPCDSSFFCFFIQGNYMERSPHYFKSTLIAFTQLHTFTPGCCAVQPQSELGSSWG